jgi:signal peptidase I
VKARRGAVMWLEMAEKIHDYRRDILTPVQLEKLQAARSELKALVKAKAGSAQVKPAIEKLEAVMKETGGKLYPASSIVENVEFFLVAAIVILGLRAYFVQPFKIPTNSMYPSYYGMKAETFAAGQEPGPVKKIARLLGLGAMNYSVEAPADGEVMLAVFPDLSPAYAEKSGRSMLVFPTTMHEYGFSVGGQQATLKVSSDFQSEFNKILDAKFRGSATSLAGLLRQNVNKAGTSLESSIWRVRGGAEPVDARVYWIPTGKMVRKGDTIVSFDILTGDLLFVDRISYNFIQPKVGSGFVFKTGNIPALKERVGDRYFVKRLVGLPGDTLEVKAPVLWRNGKPIDGSPAFGRNARQEGLYPGYTNTGSLTAGTSLTVEPHFYFAMGDNSPDSYDSRGWGFVPEKDVVGRPLFIYYPLTTRWGPAH